MRCHEYIAVYVDDLCIAAESPNAIIQIFKSKYHLKVKGDGKLTYHLGADYFEDPDGTFVSQPRKYIDELADTYKRLFNEDPPKGYKTPLDKNDHPEFQQLAGAPDLFITVLVQDLIVLYLHSAGF